MVLIAPLAQATGTCEEAPNDNADVCVFVDGYCDNFAQREAYGADGQMFVGACLYSWEGTYVCVTNPNGLPNTVGLWCSPGVDNGVSTCAIYSWDYDPSWGGEWTSCALEAPVSPNALYATAAPYVNTGIGLAFFVVGLGVSVAFIVVNAALCATSNPVLSCV